MLKVDCPLDDGALLSTDAADADVVVRVIPLETWLSFLLVEMEPKLTEVDREADAVALPVLADFDGRSTFMLRPWIGR